MRTPRAFLCIWQCTAGLNACIWLCRARLVLLWYCSGHSLTYTGVILVLTVFVFNGTTIKKGPPPVNPHPSGARPIDTFIGRTKHLGGNQSTTKNLCTAAYSYTRRLCTAAYSSTGRLCTAGYSYTGRLCLGLATLYSHVQLGSKLMYGYNHGSVLQSALPGGASEQLQSYFPPCLLPVLRSAPSLASAACPSLLFPVRFPSAPRSALPEGSAPYPSLSLIAPPTLLPSLGPYSCCSCPPCPPPPPPPACLSSSRGFLCWFRCTAQL